MDYGVCTQCDGVILRLAGGMWEHLDSRDWSHMPEVVMPMLTEAQAESELRRNVGDGLHYDPTAGDFVKVVKLRDGGFL